MFHAEDINKISTARLLYKELGISYPVAQGYYVSDAESLVQQLDIILEEEQEEIERIWKANG